MISNEKDVDLYDTYRQGCIYVGEISLKRNISSSSSSYFNITVKLVSEDGKSATVKAFNLRDIRIDNISSLLGALVSIKFVGDRQLEGIKYLIHDSESDIFSFFCERYEIEESAD